MTLWQAFFLGIMVAYTPGFIWLAMLLWPETELPDDQR